MALKSRQFRGDQRLEAAAVSDASHVQLGDRGEFVAKIQNALNLLDRAGLAEDGDFGAGTARAVLAYKTARGIINRAYQSQPDAIVGRMTVAAMDAELVNLAPSVDPVVVIGRPVVAAPIPHPYRPMRSRLTGDGQTAPAVNVTVQAIIRGNPYKSENATPFPGVPPSIPPWRTYAVDVTIQPALAEGQTVELKIIAADDKCGTAVVFPDKLTASRQVTVASGRPTEPGHGGGLRIQASLNGKVLATSEGFSICAHPSAVRILSAERLEEPPEPHVVPHIGIKVKEQFESDSGSSSDLSQAQVNELVEEVQRDSPPFSASGNVIVAPAYMSVPRSGIGFDSHGYRPSRGKAGKMVDEQVHVFKCLRCGAQHIPIPSSGFEIVAETSTPDGGKTWKLKVTKKATKTGVYLSPDDGVPKKVFNADPGLGDASNVAAEVIPKRD